MPFLLRLISLMLIGGVSGCSSAQTDATLEDFLREFLKDKTAVEIQVPAGFPELIIPTDNPTTQEGIDLGRRLFHDTRLSADQSMSCASCHQPSLSFSDSPQQFSVGIDGISGTRNTPALVNPGWLPTLFWDGRATSLEEQALEPVENPVELHANWGDVVQVLSSDSELVGMFEAAFGSPIITTSNTVKAIAQFERTLISDQSKFDQYLRGDVELTESENRGFELFMNETGDCFHCHGNRLFTDHQFHNIGLDATPDQGRAAVTGLASDIGKYKTPTLRNVEFTSPYMHDGRFTTLSDVLDHYNGNAVFSDTVDPLIRVETGLGLTDQQKLDIIEFLKTLSDPDYLNNKSFKSVADGL